MQPHTHRRTVGHVSLATDVLNLAVKNVAKCLTDYDFANGEYREWLWSEAVTSWAWICGLHGIRLPAAIVYQAVDMDTEDVMHELRARFNEIDARLMRRIDDEAFTAPGWVLPTPDSVRVTPPDYIMKTKGETR